MSLFAKLVVRLQANNTEGILIWYFCQRTSIEYEMPREYLNGILSVNKEAISARKRGQK